MTLTTGSYLGRYQIVEPLGAGGMGMVYRARDDRLKRDVAIKLLLPTVLADDHARRRFRREALALARLNHPNIATVHDVGEELDAAYIVMECVPGESLATRLTRGRLSVADTLAISVQIAAALSEAHEQGIVHRDLKPANVMITPKGHVKVLDFGLAKLLAPSEGESLTLSHGELGGPAGTPLYMSPEQAFGDPVDSRTDLWSLGVVVFESLAGRAPFMGPNHWAVLRALSEETPPSLASIRSDVPFAVDNLVSRALTRDVSARYQSAAEMVADATGILATMSAPAGPSVAREPVARPRTIVPLILALLLLVGAGGWMRVRSVHRDWARRLALPIATRLEEANLPLAAFAVLHRAESYLPVDPALREFAKSHGIAVQVTSTPSGVPVAVQDYLTPDSAWVPLGTTPLASVVLPKGYFRWRLSPPGRAPFIVAPQLQRRMSFALDSTGQVPAGMVRVLANTYGDYIAFIGWVGPYELPTFDIEQFEVTNRDYQQFVDSGGYRNPEYWREPFLDQGKPLSRNEAMTRFTDVSGRPGPATWRSGHYPDGQADYPVGGISWYEASAYAAFRGKSLPTMAQWHDVAPTEFSPYIVHVSNVSSARAVPVGTFAGVGPYGTYDMAGNVREWTLNASDDGARFILGGGWSSPGYLYAESERLPPFDRSAMNGVRCVRNLGPLPPETTRAVRMLKRDFAHVTPASDAVFAAYRVMYAYDRTPLEARAEGVVRQTNDWRVEKVSYDAAYGGDRITAYLYLPAHVKPPYQTVVFFPSANVLFLHDSRTLGDEEFFDYIVQSGRAVIYPVYQDTYERGLRGVMPGASQDLALTTQRSKDVSRTLDYLQSRPDVDHDRLAYLGVSMGAAEGAIYATLAQDRLRTVLFLDGGYFLGDPPAGGDQADFVPRLKKPVLMVNGRYDATFSYQESQLPMFRMLGTPAADKKHVVLETSHDVTSERSALVREVRAWLDRYMGRVE